MKGINYTPLEEMKYAWVIKMILIHNDHTACNYGDNSGIACYYNGNSDTYS